MGSGNGGLSVHTIGHSNQPLDGLLAALRGPGIAAVIDVRSVPYSQWTPHFNRPELERALAAAGVRYAFAGEFLGGRPADPTCYRAGVLPEGDANYLALVDYDEVARRPWFRRGLERLVEIAAAEPAAILCSEEDPLRCHRHHLIARALLAQGVAVGHIRKGGTVEAAAPEPKQMSLLP